MAAEEVRSGLGEGVGPVESTPAAGVGTVPASAPALGRWKPSIILNVPPDHAKSSYFSKRWPVWRICQDRDWQILIVSATNELASQFIGWIAAQLEENEKLIELYGGFKSDDKSCSWQPGSGKLRAWGSSIRGGYNIMSRGKEQQKQGLRAREVVIDDMIEPDDVLTAERRAKDSHEYHSVILSRVRGGITRVIGTRQHPLDIYDELSKERDRSGNLVYEHINFPALRDPLTGTPSVSDESLALWDCESEGREHRVFSPSGWPDCCRPRDFLLSAACYGRVGENAFNLTYQQVPQAEGSNWFDRKFLEACRNPNRDIGEAKWPREESIRVVHYDPGPTQFGVIWISDVRKPSEVYEIAPIDWIRRKGLDPEDAWAILEQWQNEYGPINYFIPERNSWNWFDKHPVNDWCARRNIRIKKHHTGWNKSATDIGVRTLDVDFEFGRVDLPYKSIEAKSKTNLFIDEAVVMPYGRTNDQVMAFWLPKPHFRDMWVLRTSPRKAHSHWKTEKPGVWGKRIA